ncbi:class III lanthionine synthetase LanKC [Actinoalloteichus caeruleus]|uniref:class III lanthionine synthetase LanKC n=1 Tax=Actinoalloteichus cyanogriseus TaxID=2893586 RepID=UPI003BB96FB1
MPADLSFTFANDDFYEPLAEAPPGTRYTPTRMPPGWDRADQDVWTHWSPPQAPPPPDHGWKVHVSSTPGNARAVLDVVAAACVDLGIPFKHLAGRTYFLLLHGKHASRPQSGKFCALYPADPRQAHEVLRRLEHDLAGVPGPYVLTDRRFGSSRCVSYRYGAFRSRYRLEADGTRTPVMAAADGDEIPDDRRPEFHLPAGVADPFVEAEPDLSDGPVAFHGYTFDAVLQHSNAGGAYRATDATGRQVFLKEARSHVAHSGRDVDAHARLTAEYLVLRALHAGAPGLAPEPVERFDHWEHAYLATELVPGRPLSRWLMANNPAIRVDQPAEAFTDYYRRCGLILDQLRDQLDRLHELGYVFVDVSPRNVLVDDEDRVRLVDFESTQRRDATIQPLATPGFVPPEALSPDGRATLDPVRYDDYGLAAIARMMLVPTIQVAERSPSAVDHVTAALEERAPLPATLWARADRFRGVPAPGPALPSPEAVAAEPHEWLSWLRDHTASALLALAEPDHPRRVFPTIPDGHRSNTRCVAYGSAGVLHALRMAGHPPAPALVTRLRDESLAGWRDIPPGLLFGSAGIAWVLAQEGEWDAAERLLRHAGRHPLVTRSATLGGGSAGLALAELSLYCRTGEESALDRARALLETLPTGEGLTPLLGGDDRSGLAQGRPGVALALYYLGRLTGDDAPLERGLDLLRAELVHAQPWETGALGFRVSARDRRTMPYLYAGSAGYVHVLARYLAWRPDPHLADVLDRCVRGLRVRFTIGGGLFTGQAGMGFVLGETARLLGAPASTEDAVASGRALFHHAVPHATGVRWPGLHGNRLSAELWSGAAGVLLALHQLVDPAPDRLFTLDLPVADRTGQPATTRTGTAPAPV